MENLRNSSTGHSRPSFLVKLTLRYGGASLERHLHTTDFVWPYVNQFLELGYNLQLN